MKNIAFIPIDDRNVCYELPKDIISCDKSYKLFLPDKMLLGNLNKPADIKGIYNWLSELKNIDIIIVSLDTLAYGGLISSRRSLDNIDIIKKRIDEFILKTKKLKAKVYAFSSIMRIPDNNFNEEEKDYYNLYGKKIFEYSYNLHKKEKTFVSDCDKKIEQALKEIPENILKDYLEGRKRNFEINKYYIELKKQGYFDTLVFSKDDCAEYGLNVKEAEELKLYSESEENIFIKTGADEIPLTLLSRAINSDKKVKIAPVYSFMESIDKISKYEDISVSESVESQIELSGGEVSSFDECDMVLYVNNFKNEQGELVMGVDVPLYEGSFKPFDKPYFIADILNANGGDNNFVLSFLKNTDLKEFYGYAGWNTTGNTLGSSISAAMTYYKAKNPDKKAFKRLQLIRFLDDWAYQANIRNEIRNNSDNLKNNIVKEKMVKYENILSGKFNINQKNIKYYFPWNRFFEVGINI